MNLLDGLWPYVIAVVAFVMGFLLGKSTKDW
jgi:hypothetical protein